MNFVDSLSLPTELDFIFNIVSATSLSVTQLEENMSSEFTLRKFTESIESVDVTHD